MNKPISFHIAKMLKEKGFNRCATQGYTLSGEKYFHQGGQESVRNGQTYYEGSTYTGEVFLCSAPTIAEVVMWIYETYSIWITVSPFYIVQGRRFSVDIFTTSNEKLSVSHCITPDEAYEVGIKTAILYL